MLFTKKVLNLYFKIVNKKLTKEESKTGDVNIKNNFFVDIGFSTVYADKL